MTGYRQVLLKNLIDEMGEDWVKLELAKYSCPMNLDVECFAKCKSIEFAKQNTSPSICII